MKIMPSHVSIYTFLFFTAKEGETHQNLDAQKIHSHSTQQITNWISIRVEHLALDQNHSYTNSNLKQDSKISILDVVLDENQLTQVFASFFLFENSQVCAQNVLVIMKSGVCPLYKKSGY